MGVSNLRYVTLRPDVSVKTKAKAFVSCQSLAVFAASVGFEVDNGDKFGSGNWKDPTIGITRFQKLRN